MKTSMQLSNVYLLPYPKRNCFKIGKANDVDARVRQLNWLGPVDTSNSYELEVPEYCVFDVETSLKNTFREYRVDVGLGDGKTELFDISVLPEAIVCAKYSVELIKRSRLKKRSANFDSSKCFSKIWGEPYLPHHLKQSYERLDQLVLNSVQHSCARSILAYVAKFTRRRHSHNFNYISEKQVD